MNSNQSTIDIFRNVLAAAPVSYPSDRRAEAEKALAALSADDSADLGEVESRLIALGRELWPHQEAYRDFYKAYGEARERALMREKLSPASREALDRFNAEGGSVESVRDSRFEKFFSPDAQSEIAAAELDAHDAVRDELSAMIAGEKKSEFDALLERAETKAAAVAAKIAELKALAGRAPRQAAEIAEKARTFELGFASIEPLPSAEAISHEIEYYIDTMETGE